MTILNWIKRRTKSRYADDNAVNDFTRVARDQSTPFDYDEDKRLVELLSGDEDPAVNLDEVAGCWGSRKRTPSCSGWIDYNLSTIWP